MPKLPIDQQSAQRTRDRLIRAAQEVMAESGWGAVTTRRVASAAGVNQALIHYHFRSVADLRRGAVTAVLDEIADQVAASLPRGELTDDGLHALLRLLHELQRSDPTSALVAMEGSVACLRDEGLRTTVSAMITAFRDEIAGWLIAQGHEPPQARRRATAIAAALDGICLHHLIDPTIDPDEAIEPLLDLARPPVTTGGAPSTQEAS